MPPSPYPWYNPVPWIMPETLWAGYNYMRPRAQSLWDAVVNMPINLIPYEDALEQSWAHGYIPPSLPNRYSPTGQGVRNYMDTMSESVQRTQKNVDRIRQGK